MLSLQADKVLGALGIVFVAVFTVDDKVLNAYAEFAGQVDAGLGREDGPSGDGLVVNGVCSGIFVNLNTQRVAVTVAEVRAVAGGADDIGCRVVYIAAAYTAAAKLNACKPTGVPVLVCIVVALNVTFSFGWTNTAESFTPCPPPLVRPVE